jgi:hypothetical protein
LGIRLFSLIECNRCKLALMTRLLPTLIAALVMTACTVAGELPWVSKSNANVKLLLELTAKYARMLVKEVVVFDERERIRAVVHWQGGAHTEVKVARLSLRDSGRPTSIDTVEIIRGLARQLPDRFITRVLNRLRIPTAKGHTWNEARVRAIRHGYEIAVYQEGEREGRGELNMLEAARELKVDRGIIRALIESGHLPASQVCAYAPWVIRREDLMSPKVQRALPQEGHHSPCAKNQNQLSLEINDVAASAL